MSYADEDVAAGRARRQGVRVGLLARLGREGHRAARRARGDRRELRAHPPLQPDRDGRPAAPVPRRGVGRVAGADGRGGHSRSATSATAEAKSVEVTATRDGGDPVSFEARFGSTLRTRFSTSATAASSTTFCASFTDHSRLRSAMMPTRVGGTKGLPHKGTSRLVPGQSRLRGRSRRHPSLATDAQAWRGPCGPPASHGPASPYLFGPCKAAHLGILGRSPHSRNCHCARFAGLAASTDLLAFRTLRSEVNERILPDPELRGLDRTVDEPPSYPAASPPVSSRRSM